MYSIQSPDDPSYNCFAWAAGDNTRWWEPSGIGGHYWPPSLQTGYQAYTADNYLSAFQGEGYEQVGSAEFEIAYEKVAFFVNAAGQPTHAARQLENGHWVSKLGELVDIEHAQLAALEGESYGTVAVVMRRRRRTRDS
jgi:hypothetical protein